MYNPGANVPLANKSTSRVAAELHRLAPHYEFSVVDNVVFTRGLISAVVDFVIVDRYGVLIVDAEPHEGASVHGTDTDTKWTATFASGQVAEFRNPLHLNAGNENLVKQALADVGVNLEPAEIRSAVVFTGADIARLSLVEVSAVKVKTAENLSELFEARRAFPPSSGRLTGADIDHIVSIVAERSQATSLDEEVSAPWQSDPAVIASTEAALLVAPPPPAQAAPLVSPPARSDLPSSMRLELAGHHTGATEGPSMRSALLTMGTIVVIVLTVVAGIVFFPQLQAGSTVAWTVALVLLVALAELVAASIAASPSRAGRPREGGRAGAILRFALRLLLVFVLVAGAWMFIAGGVAESIGESITSTFGPEDTVGSSAATPLTPGVIAAKKRLREKAPQVYKSVSNLNSPSVYPEDGGVTSYTWSYMPKGSSVPASFTLTIDAEGKVVSQ